MQPLEYFVGFWRPWKSWMGMFGHVEMWGYTIDDTWFFLDPRGMGAKLYITHLHDEVEAQILARIEVCETILKLQPHDRTLFPLHGPLTCAAIVGHHLGVRALTPSGLKRRLLAIGAEVIHARSPEREPAGQGSPHSGAEGV
jgi:hypothetical protein